LRALMAGPRRMGHQSTASSRQVRPMCLRTTRSVRTAIFWANTIGSVDRCSIQLSYGRVLLRTYAVTARARQEFTQPSRSRLVFALAGASFFSAPASVSGEGGIRTLDTAFGPYNGLANRRLRPLGHLSKSVVSRPVVCPPVELECPDW